METCHLCKKKANLELSHFIPKFVGKWIKKTSITGYLRQSDNVHKRQQDLPKEYWLCGDCEDLFSKWETEFSKKVFHSYIKDTSIEIKYDEWLIKFCASLTWRTLTYCRNFSKDENKSDNYYTELNNAENHLSDFLLGYENNLHQYEQHLYPLDSLESTSHKKLPSNINRYLQRSPIMDILDRSDNILIYTKLPYFILIGIIKIDNPIKLKKSKIDNKSGVLSLKTSVELPDGILNYIINQAELISKSYKQISKSELEKFNKSIINNPDTAANSKLFEAFIDDYRLSGECIFKED